MPNNLRIRNNTAEGVISQTITYGGVRNRTGEPGSFVQEVARMLVYFAQTQVVSRNVLKKRFGRDPAR